MMIQRRKRSESLTPEEYALFLRYVKSFGTKVNAAIDMECGVQTVYMVLAAGSGNPDTLKKIRSRMKAKKQQIDNYKEPAEPVKIKKNKRSDSLTKKDYAALKRYVSSFDIKEDALVALNLNRPTLNRILHKGTGLPKTIAAIKYKLQRLAIKKEQAEMQS